MIAGLASFVVQCWEFSTQKTQKEPAAHLFEVPPPVEDKVEATQSQCVFFVRVGKRVRLRYDLHPQRGHEGAAGGRGRPQTGGDQLLPHQGE